MVWMLLQIRFFSGYGEGSKSFVVSLKSTFTTFLIDFWLDDFYTALRLVKLEEQSCSIFSNPIFTQIFGETGFL